MAPKLAQYTALAKQLVGRTINNGVVHLGSVITVGAFGVIFRGEVRQGPLLPAPYAVKCIITGNGDDDFVYTEARLHALSTEHENVVRLRRVIKEDNLLFLVMDFYEGDLFTAITEKQLYLGRTEMIRHAFLQVLDAVEHCHSIGVYHRDIKPENILYRVNPSDNRPRLAVADFGLATASELCWEMGVGSTYYMAPECYGDVEGGVLIRRERTSPYSARAHDVWALGVLLINLACGRNPWKRAHYEDTTFSNYLKNPQFLMSILPISRELNELLRKIFTCRWEDRISLDRFREEVMHIQKFTLSSGELENAPPLVKLAAGQLMYDRVVVEEKVERALAVCRLVERPDWTSDNSGESDMVSHFSFDSGSDFDDSDLDDMSEGGEDPYMVTKAEYPATQIKSHLTTRYATDSPLSELLQVANHYTSSNFLFVDDEEMMGFDSPGTSSSDESDSPYTPPSSIAPHVQECGAFNVSPVITTIVDSPYVHEIVPEVIIAPTPSDAPKERNSFMSLVSQIKLPTLNSKPSRKLEGDILSASSMAKATRRSRRPSTLKLLSHLRPTA
ncbi:hypothetical protein FRC02_001891 [Tulasnella sp. 418]|nr:hypothetical protein FRC02_001891 [Tulasnella sp. 418]